MLPPNTTKATRQTVAAYRMSAQAAAMLPLPCRHCQVYFNNALKANQGSLEFHSVTSAAYLRHVRPPSRWLPRKTLKKVTRFHRQRNDTVTATERAATRSVAPLLSKDTAHLSLLLVGM
ncbi:hypothetical protein RRF57_008828 [Xylaria bambusicola]|uniref:Uncharacterized protein n=1 Tax=Xylaria bambusicola TaxID=326684 RepID=A0AAN7USQ5_9PEZI